MVIILSAGELSAQDNNILNRISTAERSDGKGYVVRFHLEQKVDSFKVIQSRTDLIQMTIYENQIASNSVQYDTTTAVYDEIGLFDLPFGMGVDLYLPSEQYYLAEAYHDKHSEDLLLGLTETGREEVEFLAEDIDPV
ncbi:MAG: hypothetical protein R3281_15090, partial [Balneolaceae bacterium]|nr:hypothetical protein [Balneolaceae bacterium]